MTLSIILLVFSAVMVLFGVWQLSGIGTGHGKPKGEDDSMPSVTVSGKSAVVTVRNAAGGDLRLFFGEASPDGSSRAMPLAAAEDTAAENEVTILDELRNPDTPAQRKAAIEADLEALGYRIVKKAPGVKPKAVKVETPRKTEVPQKIEPTPEGPAKDNTGGTDEGLGEQEPQFEQYRVQQE